MHKPFAITLNRRLVAGQPAPARGAPSARGTWTCLPPCNKPRARPARTSSSWLFHAEEVVTTRRRGARSLAENNPLPAIMGRVCYHPCEDWLQPPVGRRLGRHQRGGALPRRRGPQAGLVQFAAPAEHQRQAGAGRRFRPGSGLAAAYHLTLDSGIEARRCATPAPIAGGMMRFGIPEVPAAAGSPRCRGQADQSITGVELQLATPSVEHSVPDALKEGFDAVFLGVGAHIGKRAYIPAGETANKVLDAVSRTCTTSKDPRKRSPCSGARSSSTAAATPPSTPPAQPSEWALKRRSSSIAATATRCPAHDFEVVDAEAGGHHPSSGSPRSSKPSNPGTS
jgi:hypothetical protein